MSLYGSGDLAYRPLELSDLLDGGSVKDELENGATIFYEGRVLRSDIEHIILEWPPKYEKIEYPSNIQPEPNPCTYQFTFTRRDGGGTLPVCFLEDGTLKGEDVGKWHITIPPIPEPIPETSARSHRRYHSSKHRRHRHDERGPSTTGGGNSRRRIRRSRKSKKSRKYSKRRH